MYGFRPWYKLIIGVLFSTILVAGCLSLGEHVQVVSESSQISASANGEPVEVQVQVFVRGNQPVHVDRIQVEGMTGDKSIPLPPVQVDRTIHATPAGVTSEPISFYVEAEDLAAQGVTHLHLWFDSHARSLLSLELVTGRDPSTPPVDDSPIPPNGDDDSSAPPDNDDQDPAPDPDPDPPTGQSTEVRTLRAGTSQATNVYIIRSTKPGPTVLLTGGIHGSETSGWLTAWEIIEWEIDAGTLVVIPEANKPAVDRRRRTGPDGLDLNRQFPVNSAPQTDLAEEIWDVVLEFRPVALMDMHEGWGLYGVHFFPGGTPSVGQTLITYNTGDAMRFANYVTSYLDTYHVLNQQTYSFTIIGPPISGSLARKAGRELGIPAFINEPSQHETRLTTRIRWQKVFVEELLKWYGVLDQDRYIVPKEYRAGMPAGVAVQVAAAVDQGTTNSL